MLRCESFIEALRRVLGEALSTEDGEWISKMKPDKIDRGKKIIVAPNARKGTVCLRYLVCFLRIREGSFHQLNANPASGHWVVSSASWKHMAQAFMMVCA